MKFHGKDKGDIDVKANVDTEGFFTNIPMNKGYLTFTPNVDILTFLSQCTVETTDAAVGTNDLFQAWQEWYDSQRSNQEKGKGTEYNNRIGRTIFNNNVAACGYINECIDGEVSFAKLVSVWRGIALREKAELDEEIRVFNPEKDWRSEMIGNLVEYAEGIVPIGQIGELINVYSTHSVHTCEVDDSCLHLALSLVHLQGEIDGNIIDWDQAQNQYVIRPSHFSGKDLVEKIREVHIPSEGTFTIGGGAIQQAAE